MRPECVSAVIAAAASKGRTLTEASVRSMNMDGKVREALKALRQKDIEGYRDMTEAQRLEAATKMVADEIISKKILDKKREAAAIITKAELTKVVDEMAAQTGEPKLATLFRVLFMRFDGKASTFSLEARKNATQKYYRSQLHDFFALGDRGYFGSLFSDPEGSKALVKELWGEDSGNPMAKKAAEGLRTVIGRQIGEYQSLHGLLNAREDYHHPQYTSPRLARKMGQQGYVEFVMNNKLLDRGMYTNEDGTPMSDAQFAKFLEEVWKSPALDGLGKKKKDAEGKSKPGGAGTGAMGNQRGAHRQLFFKNADAWIKYHEALGEKDMYSVMLDHVDGLSSDIATLKVLTHNPQAFFKSMIDDATEADAATYKGVTPPKGALEKVMHAVFGEKAPDLMRDNQKLQDALNYLIGGMDRPSETRIARFFRGYRNYTVHRLLGSLPFSMLPDQATMIQVGRQNGAVTKLIWQGQARYAADKSFRENLRSLGLGLDVYGQELSRQGERDGAVGKTGWLASATHRVSGATAINNTERSVMEFMLTSTWARLVKGAESLADLHPQDHRVLLSKGLTEADWQVWRLAEPDELDGERLLTPKSIDAIPDEKLAHLGDPEKVRQEAILKLYGALDGEVNSAILNPSAEGSFQLKTFGGRLDPNSDAGEVIKTILQFQSFPWEYFRRHSQRMQMETGALNKGLYLGGTMVMSTLLAGAGMSLLAMAKGEDPEDITANPGNFGLRAFLKGGGLGYWGGLLLTPEKTGEDAVNALVGPFLGDVTKVVSLAKDAYIDLPAADDEAEAQRIRDDMAKKAVKLVKSYTPFQNLWQTRTFYDRWLFDQAQEAVNPGAMDRMKQRAAQRGTSHWWQPGEAVPDRAPDIGKAVGESATQ